MSEWCFTKPECPSCDERMIKHFTGHEISDGRNHLVEYRWWCACGRLGEKQMMTKEDYILEQDIPRLWSEWKRLNEQED